MAKKPPSHSKKSGVSKEQVPGHGNTYGTPADRAAAILAMAARASLPTVAEAAEQLKWDGAKAKFAGDDFESKRKKAVDLLESRATNKTKNGPGPKKASR